MRSLDIIGCHKDLGYCRACPERCFSGEELAEPVPATSASDGILPSLTRRFWRSFLTAFGVGLWRQRVAK